MSHQIFSLFVLLASNACGAMYPAATTNNTKHNHHHQQRWHTFCVSPTFKGQCHVNPSAFYCERDFGFWPLASAAAIAAATRISRPNGIGSNRDWLISVCVSLDYDKLFEFPQVYTDRHLAESMAGAIECRGSQILNRSEKIASKKDVVAVHVVVVVVRHFLRASFFPIG